VRRQTIIFRGPVTTPHRLAEFTIRLNYFAHTFTNRPEGHIDRENYYCQFRELVD